jgi:hypothetical protein
VDTGVALLAAGGVDPSEIARRVGHSSVAFTYHRQGHLLPEVDKQATTKLETSAPKPQPAQHLARTWYILTGRQTATPPFSITTR